jgi:transposase
MRISRSKRAFVDVFLCRVSRPLREGRLLKIHIARGLLRVGEEGIDGTALSSTTRQGETESAQAEPAHAADASRLDGSALVLGYLTARAQGPGDLAGAELQGEALRRRVRELEATVAELAARLSELSAVEQQAEELRRLTERLKAQNQELQETIRTLEIGFRRHVSEQVSPEQLRLALAEAPAASPAPSAEAAQGAEARTCADRTEASHGPPPAESPTEQAEAAAPPSGPSPKGRKPANRHKHGRRRISVIPKWIVETTPPEVLLKGSENFERVGTEESSQLVHRRGGLMELVTRRPKYVLKSERPVSAGAPEEQPSAAAAGAPNGGLVVQEQEALSIPADPGFKRSPFVDGALVRYTPESTDGGDAAGPVWIAPVPERPIDRGLADPSLLAHVIVNKQDYHTPYYRQELSSERYGFRIGRATMARWQFECGGIELRIADAMWTDALSRSWFAMDATGTAIRDKEKYRYGHVFVLVAPGDGVLFRYTPKYDGDTVEELFGGYQGTLVADASANHNGLFGPGKAREAGCWSHGRRRFFKAFKAGAGKPAAFALQTIQALFRIEEEIALLSPDERLQVRQDRSAPLIEALFSWVDEQLPETAQHAPLREGLVYLHNQRQALCEFLVNGEIPIHNNASERALRRIVKGRQNWLCHGSDEHARRACALCSLIASCQIHGLDPEFYLQEILTVAPSYPLSRILDLSPKNWVATRTRLIAEGRLKYLDLARLTGSKLVFRDP